VIVIGKGSSRVALAVGEISFRQLKVGQHATISQAGGKAVPGVVSAKALLPTSSTTGSSSTFGVTVTAPKSATSPLTAGATASVVVRIASVDDAVLVPVSAVTRTSTTSGTVSLLSHGVVTTTRVTLGVIGDTSVQITDGLAAGAVVVLADRSAEVPSNSTNSLRQFANGRAGGFGGGGFGGGGFGGGAPPAGGAGGAGGGQGPR
jgi:HlyD family secretion protein